MIKFYTCLAFLISVIYSEADIGFPEDDPPVNHNERQTLYIPGRCPENQLLYPVNNSTDYICDCGPRFVYYLPHDKCYELYRRGPCKINEYLVLRRNELMSKCVKNPCRDDTMVPFKGECYQLHKSNGCPPLILGGGVLGVNSTTLEIECQTENAAELNIININPSKNPCQPGSKRSSAGLCRQLFNYTIDDDQE